MNQRKQFAAAGASLGMLLLILDSRCALDSAREGMELCIRTVIPSLFPFLFLSGLVTGALWGNSGKFLKLAAKTVHIPSGAESVFLSGFLGGYPAGAAAIGTACRSGQLDRDTANRLLAFCSNAGPAFLFGMIGPQFPEKWMAWCLWGIHILSAAIVGRIYVPQTAVQAVSAPRKGSSRSVMQTSLQIMGTVCGWILLFRIVIGFLDRWFLWLLPEWARVLIWGVLELSNGCCALTEIQDISLRFITAAAMVSFGGVCVVLQTASVLSGLSMKYYMAGKLIQTACSILLAAAVMKGWWLAVLLPGMVLLRYPKKSSSIPSVTVV